MFDRAKYQRDRRKAKITLGICIHCSTKALPDSDKCKKHYDRSLRDMLASVRKQRAVASVRKSLIEFYS